MQHKNQTYHDWNGYYGISLIPLAVSGGALWAPMATAIISGMVISSFLTMYIIPCAYIVVEGEASMLRKFTDYLKNR